MSDVHILTIWIAELTLILQRLITYVYNIWTLHFCFSWACVCQMQLCRFLGDNYTVGEISLLVSEDAVPSKWCLWNFFFFLLFMLLYIVTIDILCQKWEKLFFLQLVKSHAYYRWSLAYFQLLCLSFNFR